MNDNPLDKTNSLSSDPLGHKPGPQLTLFNQPLSTEAVTLLIGLGACCFVLGFIAGQAEADRRRLSLSEHLLSALREQGENVKQPISQAIDSAGSQVEKWVRQANAAGLNPLQKPRKFMGIW